MRRDLGSIAAHQPLERAEDQQKRKQSTAVLQHIYMPTSTELPLNATSTGTRDARSDASVDELSHVKRELLRSEVRLARARATAAGAEADVKVLSARLRVLSK